MGLSCCCTPVSQVRSTGGNIRYHLYSVAQFVRPGLQVVLLVRTFTVGLSSARQQLQSQCSTTALRILSNFF
jgi:hypothetical protein